MSDRLEGYDLSKFKQNISLSTEHCLNYVKQDCIDGDNIAFTVNIPNEHLRSWRDLREEGGLLCQFSYVEILNAMIDEYGVKIKEDCARIDGLLQRSSGTVKSNCRKLQGRARLQYLSNIRKIAIRQDELINVGLIEEELNITKENARGLLKENEQVQKRCEELYTELQSALQTKKEVENKLDDVENNYETILSKNKDLREYIDRMPIVKNSGKVVSEVGERQQQRKLKELKTQVERTLWFAETYGLSLDSVSLTDQKEVTHTLTFSRNDKKQFKDLPEEEKDKIKQILFRQIFHRGRSLP